MSAAGEMGTDLPSPLRGEGGAKRRVRGRTPSLALTRARSLRSNQTDAERRLWNLLRNRSFENLKFVRQHAVGPFIADLVCRELMLVIEVDGSQHADSAEDERRTAFLNAQGYSVLRFWNNEVLSQLEGVYDLLSAVVAGYRPSPSWRFSPATLSPEGRGEQTEAAATGRNE